MCQKDHGDESLWTLQASVMQRKENQCDVIERVELTHQKKRGTKTNQGRASKLKEFSTSNWNCRVSQVNYDYIADMDIMAQPQNARVKIGEAMSYDMAPSWMQQLVLSVVVAWTCGTNFAEMIGSILVCPNLIFLQLSGMHWRQQKIEKRRIQQKRNKIRQREINYLFIIVRTCVWISICEMTIHKYKRTLRNNIINKPKDQNFEVSIDKAGEQQTLNKQKNHTGLRNSVNGVNPIALNPCLIQYSKTIYSFWWYHLFCNMSKGFYTWWQQRQSHTCRLNNFMSENCRFIGLLWYMTCLSSSLP